MEVDIFDEIETQVPVVVVSPEITKFETSLETFTALMNYQVMDQATVDYATLTVQNGKTFLGEVAKYFDPKVEALYVPYKNKLDEKNKYVKPVEAVIKHLAHGAAKFVREENDRIELKHRQELAAERAKQLSEAAAAEVLRKQKEEDDAFFDIKPAPVVPVAVISVHNIAVAPPQKITVPVGNTRSGNLKWRWKKTDEDQYSGMRQFMDACLKDNSLFEKVGEILDDKIMRGLMSAKKEDVVKLVPGIETYREPTLSSRRGS